MALDEVSRREGETNQRWYRVIHALCPNGDRGRFFAKRGENMERDTCIRCGGTMAPMGSHFLKKGAPGWHLRGNLEHFDGENLLPVEVWCCQNCRRLDFYLDESASASSSSGIAQTRCPVCGTLHDLDDPKCPHCGTRLY